MVTAEIGRMQERPQPQSPSLTAAQVILHHPVGASRFLDYRNIATRTPAANLLRDSSASPQASNPVEVLAPRP